MENKQEFMLVRREVVTKFIKTLIRMTNTLKIMEYVCTLRKVEITLTVEEVCEILGIQPEKLEDARRRKLIKSVKFCNKNIYSAADLTVLAERMSRRRILRLLGKVPTVTMPVPEMEVDSDDKNNDQPTV